MLTTVVYPYAFTCHSVPMTFQIRHLLYASVYAIHLSSNSIYCRGLSCCPRCITLDMLLLQFWLSKFDWWQSELDAKGMKGTKIKLLEAHQVYDETIADQFLILAGTPRGPVSWWYDSCKHTRTVTHSSVWRCNLACRSCVAATSGTPPLHTAGSSPSAITLWHTGSNGSGFSLQCIHSV